jgi:tetratricopeptide (TPR) repeat protein
VKRRSFAALLALAGTSAAVGVDLGRLSAVLSGTPIDAPALDDMETLTADLIRREASLAPSALLPAVRGHLAGLQDMLIWTPSSLAPRAYSLAAQTALLAGYLMLQQERPTDADAYWLLADRLADLAGDTRLRITLLVHQAWRWEVDNLPLSLALADRAESLLGTNPDPAIAAMVLSVRAIHRSDASPTVSMHAASATHDLDRADASLRRMPPADDALYLFRSVEAQVIEMRAHTLINLGQYHDALGYLQQVLAAIDPSWLATRSYATMNLGTAIARMGEPEHACEVLSTAVQLAESASSPRCLFFVKHKYQRWLAGYDGPAAHRLHEQLQSLRLRPGGAALPAS